MASTYINNLRLNEMGTGDQSGTWGTVTNANLELIGEALGYGTEALPNATTANSVVADGSTDPARALYIKYTGTLGATCTVTIGPNTMKRLQFIENATSGGHSIIIKQGSGTTVTIPNTETKICVLDGGGAGANVFQGFEGLNKAGFDMNTNTSGHMLVANGTKFFPVAMSGDATIASNGAITIANDAVEQAMIADNAVGADQIADDAVGADQLASNAVVNASVASGAAIDATKIADGSISNTEFQYLNGVTSNIQTQLSNALTSITFPTGAWINSADGRNRLYFTANSSTQIKYDNSLSLMNNSGTTTATINNSGDFTATGNVGAYSDMALKEDIYQIENALEKVNKLRGVHFTRKSNNSKEIGVVANEVEKVVPELVDEHEDKELGKIKTMKYANTVGLLIEAVKDLSKQVEELKNGSTN
tara:strand:+ start:1128 stop:2393 length:1266 start_codon:yes stop_codon:yes gene_type:complete